MCGYLRVQPLNPEIPQKVVSPPPTLCAVRCGRVLITSEMPVERGFQHLKNRAYQQQRGFFNKNHKKPRQVLLSRKSSFYIWRKSTVSSLTLKIKTQ
jgi:hypothetical protein